MKMVKIRTLTNVHYLHFIEHGNIFNSLGYAAWESLAAAIQCQSIDKKFIKNEYQNRNTF